MAMSAETVARIIDKFPSQVALAEAIGAAQSTVAYWKRRGVIPARQQQKILEAARARQIDISPADFFDLPEAA